MNSTTIMFAPQRAVVVLANPSLSPPLSVIAYDDRTVLITAITDTDELPKRLSSVLSKILPYEKIVVDVRPVLVDLELATAIMSHGTGGNRTLLVTPAGFQKLLTFNFIDRTGAPKVKRLQWKAATGMEPFSGSLDEARSRSLCEAVGRHDDHFAAQPTNVLVAPIEHSVDIRRLTSICREGEDYVVRIHRTLASDAERSALGALLKDEIILPLSAAGVLDLCETDTPNGALSGQIVLACLDRKRRGGVPLRIRMASTGHPTLSESTGLRAGFTVEAGESYRP